MRSLFVDIARTLVKFSPGYHNELGSYLRSQGYCVSDRDVFREIAMQRAWMHLPCPGTEKASLDFAALLETLTGESPDDDTIEGMKCTGVAAQTWELYDDAAEFLENAKETGIRVVLIGSISDQNMGLVSKLGLDRLVEGAVFAANEGLRRCGADVFRRAENIAGSRGIFLGDTYEVDEADALSADLPFMLIDRDDYYSDVRRGKARSLMEAWPFVYTSCVFNEPASPVLLPGRTSPADRQGGRKPQAVRSSHPISTWPLTGPL